jgi:hypothetical protein
MPTPRLAIQLALLVCGSALAQDDLRDRVVRTDGRELRGRVAAPWAADELVLLQGGRRERIARGDVGSADLVGDRLRSFLERRRQHQGSRKAQQFLIDHALSLDLPGIARLQALWLVLRDDGDAKAHEFLGHLRSAKGWLWPLDGRRLSREQFEAAMAQRPLLLRGERFALRSDGHLQASVDALFDLEQLGVAWCDQFGAELGLREVLAPIEVAVSRSADAFPKWGFRPLPYYVPPPHGAEGRTFWPGPAPIRPERLFFVGAQGLLYQTLIGEVAQRDSRDRVCAWLEVGLGMAMELSLQGPPGFAVSGPPRSLTVHALTALGREQRLAHLLHAPMYGGFYLADDTATAANWSAATMFVQWLLEPANQPATREPFLRFVRKALGDRQGDSSSAFDKAIGRRVEDLEGPWRAWLATIAGR